MILTDKCLKDFLEYLKNYCCEYEESNRGVFLWFGNETDLLHKDCKLFLNALIIEFFDSVGIIINVKRYVMPLGEVEWYFIITGDNGAHLNNHVSEESRSVFDCRKNITEQAIKKANEIYNETKIYIP